MLEKNTPVEAISALMDSRIDPGSPFSPGLTEEIQMTASFQKILQDHRFKDGDFCVSLPIKDILLRSFVIPWVAPGEFQNVIKFESKKYIPLDIKDVSFVFHAVSFTENQIKRIQVIFFAVQKEVLARYERVFQKGNVNVFFCEPCSVSLAKALLYKKEIKPTDHLAFLYLDQNSGYICFIDKGIPQFVHEFIINAPGTLESVKDGGELTRILNEAGNSFDFYARQFGAARVDQMIVSSSLERQDLLDALATELKVKIKKFSPLISTVGTERIDHIDAMYALGAGVDAPMNSLSAFNFFENKTPKSKFGNIYELIVNEYKDVLFTFLVCLFLLVGVYVFFQMGLKDAQRKYDDLALKQGAFINEPLESIQTQIQENKSKISAYKNIRIKSDMASIMLRVASLLPQGAWLTGLNVQYEGGSVKSTHVTIDMTGYLFKDDPNEQMSAVNSLVLGFRKDKILSKFIKKVTLGSLTRNDMDGRVVTSFSIHCS